MFGNLCVGHLHLHIFQDTSALNSANRVSFFSKLSSKFSKRYDGTETYASIFFLFHIIYINNLGLRSRSRPFWGDITEHRQTNTT